MTSGRRSRHGRSLPALFHGSMTECGTITDPTCVEACFISVKMVRGEPIEDLIVNYLKRMSRNGRGLLGLLVPLVLIGVITQSPRSNFLSQACTEVSCAEVIVRVSRRIEERLNSAEAFAESLTLKKKSQAKARLFKETRYLSHHLDNANGLGNFLFITATIFGLAEDSEREAVFIRSHPHMEHFSAKFPIADPEVAAEYSQSEVTINVAEAGIYKSKLPDQLLRNYNRFVNLMGYLQSWKYFDQYKKQIRSQFAFKKEIYEKALFQINAAVNHSLTYHQTLPLRLIGVHVRRGDITKKHFRDFGHKAASTPYIRQSISKANATHPGALFFVMSNNLQYCREILGSFSNIVYVKSNPAELDLALLTLMDDLILTVGTFGWWGAYLGDPENVHYYSDWPQKGSRMSQQYRKADYFMPNWTYSE